MPDAAPANPPSAGQIGPARGGQREHALDDLHVTACKLHAIADLVGQAPDLGLVDRDGLGLLLCDLARDVDRCTDRLRAG